MCDEVERALSLQRKRQKKYRENKKSKFKSPTRPNTSTNISMPVHESLQETTPGNGEMGQSQPLHVDGLTIQTENALLLDSEYESSDFSEDDDAVEEFCDGEQELEFSNEEKLREQIRVWASEDVAGYKVNSLLRILHPFHRSLPLSSKTLLKTSHGLHALVKKFKADDPSDTSEYAYFGIARFLRVVVNLALHPTRVIPLQIHLDGMSPYRSSALQCWTTMGKVHHEEADYKPFTISAYCGRGKPDPMDLYADDLIKELDELCEHELIIDDELCEIQIKCFICDRPARSAFKCIVNHGGYYACERCLVPGFDYENRIVYPFRKDDAERTDESFKKLENPLHHTGISPLVKLKKPINIIILFILDIMHLNYQGNMKKLLTIWFSSNSKVCREKLLRVSLRLVNLSKQIPVEFQRSTRTVEDISKWTANEFREILLYTGPFVLEEILDEEEYNHFLLLHTPCRILCSSELYKKYTQCAKEYLQRFAMLTEIVYGLEFASLTNHSLGHLADDVENMDCPASHFTAFPFENELGHYKRFIRSGNRPMAQICTKIERDLEFHFKKATIATELQILRSKKIDNLLHIQKVQFKKYQFSVKSPNNVILFKDGSIVEIKSMVSSVLTTDPSKVFVLGEQVKILGPAFKYPTCSSLLREYKVERGAEGDLVKYPLSDMQCKFCLFEIFELPSDHKKLYAVPLLH